MRFKPWLIVLVICITMLLILGATKFFQIKAAIEFGESFPEASETVEAQTTSLTDWQATIAVIGTLRAPQEIELRTETAGTIAQVGFASGSAVTAEQRLLQLDISEEQARLQAVTAQIELARQNVERISGLTNKSAVSKQQSDNVASQLAVAQAEAASVSEMIANKTVTAPFSGLTGLHDFEVGEYLPANTLITKLVGKTDTLWVDFSLPQQYARFKSGTKITLRAPGFDNAGLQAEVIAVEPAISEQARDLKARALLDNRNSALKPGGVINAQVPVGQVQSVFRLPSTAIRADAFGTFVFALKKDDKQQLRAVKRPVSVAAREGDFAVILGRLDVGELIATKGSFKLREGLLVNRAPSSDTHINAQGSQQTSSAEISIEQDSESSARPVSDPTPAPTATQSPNDLVDDADIVEEGIDNVE